MTNGENTAFIPIKDFLTSRDFPGYTGYQSDSEVFAHILHYSTVGLDLGIDAYKHIITPLQEDDLRKHPDAEFLAHLKRTCRPLIIDGPNCVIGTMPDHSLFMVQDRKKLRPGVVGGQPGLFGFPEGLHAGPGIGPGDHASSNFAFAAARRAIGTRGPEQDT